MIMPACRLLMILISLIDRVPLEKTNGQFTCPECIQAFCNVNALRQQLRQHDLKLSVSALKNPLSTELSVASPSTPLSIKPSMAGPSAPPSYYSRNQAIEGKTALLIKTIQVYGRLRCNPEMSTYPTSPTAYGFLRVSHIFTDNCNILIIANKHANLLVTSSARMDMVSVNMGPHISHFTPKSATRILLNKESIAVRHQACHRTERDD